MWNLSNICSSQLNQSDGILPCKNSPCSANRIIYIVYIDFSYNLAHRTAPSVWPKILISREFLHESRQSVPCHVKTMCSYYFGKIFNLFCPYNFPILVGLMLKTTLLVFFLDSSKGFDTIDHEVQITKIHYYGNRGVTLEWLCS